MSAGAAPGRHARRWGAVALCAVAVLAASVAVQRARRSAAARAAFPEVEGRIEVPGLAGPVWIDRDRYGVPHVEAESELDAFFGWGFVHAQDRLGQMQWLLRSARGRTAEVVGPEGLAADRLARTLDLAGLARAEAERLDAASARALEAYAAGVNARTARFAQRPSALPLVLREWGAPLEPWTPADSLAVLKLYSWGLSGSLDVSLVLDDLLDRLGGFESRRFFPRRPGEEAVPSLRPPTTAGRAAGAAERVAALVPDPLRRAAGLSGRDVGSSAWVLGGAHSASGSPLLAADAHLEPSAPALLYLAHVRGGELDVAGATVPGLPVVLSGHNRHVAWGSTRARAVTTDLYEEELHKEDPDRYHDGTGWRDLDVREERIAVRGGRDVVLRVRATHHGPLVSDLVEGESRPLALRWLGSRPAGRSGFSSLLAVARADGADALLAALARHEEPVLVVAYADPKGAAGVKLAGWIPRRSLFTGLSPVPGRARWYDWTERIPAAALPGRALEGGRGWAVAAGNAFGGAADEAIEWLWRNGTRAERIDDLLRAAASGGPVDLRAFAALQNDVVAERAPELTRLALGLVDDGLLGPEANEVARVLEGWDGSTDAGNAGAAAYHVLLGALTESLFTPRLGKELLGRYLALPQTDPGGLVFEILESAALGGGDDEWSDPAVVAAAVREGLRDTWFRLSYRLGANRSKWEWGSLHRLAFRQPGSPRADRALEGLGPFAYGGDDTTVRAGEYAPGGSFDVRLASTFRFAVDTASLDQSLAALAPGQSEHEGHPHFRDGVEPWLHGRAHLLPTSRLLVEESSASRLLLAPAGGGTP